MPDLPLIKCPVEIRKQIDTVYRNCSDRILGNKAPNAQKLKNAVNAYEKLNIKIDESGEVSGNKIGKYKEL